MYQEPAGHSNVSLTALSIFVDLTQLFGSRGEKRHIIALSVNLEEVKSWTLLSDGNWIIVCHMCHLRSLLNALSGMKKCLISAQPPYFIFHFHTGPSFILPRRKQQQRPSPSSNLNLKWIFPTSASLETQGWCAVKLNSGNMNDRWLCVEKRANRTPRVPPM